MFGGLYLGIFLPSFIVCRSHFSFSGEKKKQTERKTEIPLIIRSVVCLFVQLAVVGVKKKIIYTFPGMLRKGQQGAERCRRAGRGLGRGIQSSSRLGAALLVASRPGEKRLCFPDEELREPWCRMCVPEWGPLSLDQALSSLFVLTDRIGFNELFHRRCGM